MDPAVYTNEERKRLARLKELLGRLDLLRQVPGQRLGVLLALTDDQTPNPFSTLTPRGLPISAGAPTNQLFKYAAERIGVKAIDREQRDYVFPALREVGIVDKAYIVPKKELKKLGKPIIYGSHPKPKSPNSSYVVTDEVRQLLQLPDRKWPAALDRFVDADPQRRLKVQQQAASAALADHGIEQEHAKLIKVCVERLQNSLANGFELVFVDDADGDRVNEKWQERLDELGLSPDIDSLWPDAILVDESAKKVWFADAVISDGEIDNLRANELRRWAKERGYQVAGMTTAYATWATLAKRQKAEPNLAVGSTYWIAEAGGNIYSVDSLA